MSIGIVAFSFGCREIEPGPCNIRLAEEARKVISRARHRNRNVIPSVVLQWEVDLVCNLYPDLIVSHDPLDGYLNSEKVADAAAEVFRERRISTVIVVAQPFLQLRKCRKLMRDRGFHVLTKHYEIGRIGFDKKSLQWWTRGYLRSFIYATFQVPKVFFSRRGK